MRLPAIAFVAASLFSCARPPEPEATAEIHILGAHGNREGEFVLPRGAALDPAGWLYVVDKTGRIQKFDLDGNFVRTWSPPTINKGRPTALTVDAEGSVWVANTHDHEILRYSPDGELLHRFGREGRGQGEFIYPVGILAHPDGSIVVGEYGGNDRIQVFDRRGTLLRSWGRYGDGPGEFKRPQGLALDSAGNLYVADAANHRIQVFDPDGILIRFWGRLGRAAGELMYPYGLAFAPDGNLLVCEYGTNRVQKFTPEGKPIAAWGGGGTSPGRLDTPWNIVVDPEHRLFVIDRGNHRVQIWPMSVLVN